MARERLLMRHTLGVACLRTAMEGQAGWAAGRGVGDLTSREITVAVVFGYCGTTLRAARKPSMQFPACVRSCVVCGSARLFTHTVHRRGQTHRASRVSLTLRVGPISF